MTAATNNGRQSKPEMTLTDIALQCVSDSERWFPDNAHDIPHNTLALAGEVGELANIVKKIQRGDLDWKDAKVQHAAKMELTDVFIYVSNLAGLMRVNLYEAYKLKRAENEKRFNKVD